MASSLDVPDDWGLSGKVAIVTGAGAARSGIGNGRAAAILLARAGARVIVVDREIDLAEQTARMIKDQGGEGVALQADVTRPEDCAGMVKTALDRFGRLDFLDNNVGIGSRGSVLDETQENWRRVMQVNVETMFLAAKHAISAVAPPCWGSRGQAGTSATPCAFSSRTTRATSRVRRWSWTAARRWSGPRGRAGHEGSSLRAEPVRRPLRRHARSRCPARGDARVGRGVSARLPAPAPGHLRAP